MRLIKITLNNFKKITNLVFEPNGEDRWILGKNGTGKTTIADAFYWVLTNKTSNDKKCDEDIKLKDKDGNPMLDGGVEHSVELVLELDNKHTVTLSKSYSEKWTKQNGAATKEYTGHTTTHYIDGVKRSQKDYNAFIEKEIGNIDILKMVSLTSYFCSMPWKKQREILTSICGDVSETDVINSADGLKELPDYLEGKTVNDFISILTERKRKIREQLDNLPARIDEATKALPDITGLVKDAINIELKDFITQQNNARDEIVSLQNGAAVAEMKKRSAEITTAMEKIKQAYDLENSKQSIEDERKVGELNNRKQKYIYDIEQNKTRINDFNTKITGIENELIKIRTDYKNIHNESFDESKSICPTCGQPLPAEKLASAKEKFNMDKSSRLEKIRADGKNLATKKDLFTGNIKKLTETIAASQILVEQLSKNIALINERKDNAESTSEDIKSYINDEQYKILRSEGMAISKKLLTVQENNIAEITKLRSAIDQIALDITERQKKLLTFEQYDKGQKRITELKKQQKDLAAEFETIEYKLNLAQLFIKKQVEMLDKKINSRFEKARFKLFDQQVNGGVNPCCEAITQDGSTYSTTMSTGEKVKIGLDICTTLAKHYGLNVPIIIDNAEGVTDLPQTDNQQIRLIVSTADAELKIIKPTDIEKQAVA